MSGAEHVPDDVHPERTPLREVERDKTNPFRQRHYRLEDSGIVHANGFEL